MTASEATSRADAGRPAAVIFDMDGVLFDSEVLSRDAFLAATIEIGRPATIEAFLVMVGRPWGINRDYLQTLFGHDQDIETFRAVWRRHYALLKKGLALKTGVLELLDHLDALGIPRAICTSSSHEDVAANLALHGLAPRFQAVIANGDYAKGKPAPDPFLRAAEVLGVNPAQCLALEDSYNGVRAAAAAGMRTVMVPDLLPATDEIRALCRMVAADLHEVRAHLVA
ncbi:HAD family hydrolase [Aureimonas ureilytica]|uniref:HAD family hydrolase n=1 Tax=Aureimonas ureilytica TaxID=401562 RepID=UPI0003635004|nr:HAD family phosphatase [Aureimonas ureilytica]